MDRVRTVLSRVFTAVRERFSAVAGFSERTLMLGAILVLTTVTAVLLFVFMQYFSVNLLSSYVTLGSDCGALNIVDPDAPRLGQHCFGDYAIVVATAEHANPWQPVTVTRSWFSFESYSNYPAAGMLPHRVFALIGQSVGAPALGMFAYLLALTAAVLAPAVWAARGARGLESVVVFVALGVLAVPVWTVIDRGNSAGFVVPVGLGFLLSLLHQRWGAVAVMVMLAALIKPQFVLLIVALFAARQWRWGGIALAGVAVSNLAAYLIWPRDFPSTIRQSLNAVGGYGSDFGGLAAGYNSSFAKALLFVPDSIVAAMHGGVVPEDFLAGARPVIGYGILLVVVAAALALGRRVPPVMVGIVLFATASLAPGLSLRYYLVFALPIAALIARDPDGPAGTGLFDRFRALGDDRRVVGVCVSLAAAVSLAHIALPHPATLTAYLDGSAAATKLLGPSTAMLVALAWLVVIAAILVSYARRPAPAAVAAAVP